MVEELDAFRIRARGWLAANMPRLAPDADARQGMASDEVDRFSRARELQGRLFEGGFAGLAFPEAYGGKGLDAAYLDVFVEESRPYEMPIRFVMPTHGIIGATILEFGTEAQKQRYIPAMLAGRELWVQFLSEPSCGSDLASARTTATRDGDEWILNGSKVWSSAAYGCDFALCLARTDWDVPKHDGLTMFMMPTAAPGLQIQRIRQVDGSMEFCQEFFDDVRLPADSVLGEVNAGWTVARALLGHERRAVGGGSRLIGNVNVHRSPGTDIQLRQLAAESGAARPALADQLLAEARILTVVSEQLVRRAAEAARRGQPRDGYGSVLRLFRATSTARRATIGLELAGTSALVWDDSNEAPLVGRSYLVRQAGSLAGGSSEMQRNMISEQLLGMPREPASDRDVPYSQVRSSGSRG
jgi:alkylation response protein AidB-like acyl-CoA dehydrogenase